MEKKKVAIVGGNKQGLGLLPLLERDPSVEVGWIVDPNPDALVFKLDELGFRLARKYRLRISTDWDELRRAQGLGLIINASPDPSVRARLERMDFRGVEIISALTARLLWESRGAEGRGGAEAGEGSESKLLASLNEIVEAVNLTKDKRQVTSLILKVAMESTGADNGSLMLLDPVENVLKIEVAEGIPEELIPRIRCPLGEGIAGRVALEGKPLLLSGRADDRTYRILREREDVKSALCVPLTINGSTVGVLNLNNLRSMEGFTREDLEFLTKLAAFDAEILMKSQEYEALKENAQTFQVWKSLHAAMNRTAPLGERLAEVCRVLSGHFRESLCSLYLFDPDTRELTLAANNLREFRADTGLRLGPGQGIDGWAAAAQEVVILKEYPGLDAAQKKTFLSIPLVTAGEISGVLNLQRISPHGLSEEEETLLREVGRYLADAVKSARKEDRAATRATKIEAINEAGINILSIMDLDKLLELIPPSAAMIMDADGCILRLREPRGELRIRSTYSMWEDEIRDKVFELDAEIAGRVEAVRRPVQIADLGSEPGFERFGRVVKSALALPLLDETGFQGVLTIYDKIPKGSFHATSFGDEDVEIFEKFVHYVEKALANARGASPSRAFLHSDKLTGLPNETALHREIENEINRSRRYRRRFILLTLAWRYAKAGAADYDVETRNNLVLEIAQVLQENVREYDTVARTGPLQFGILLPESVERVQDLIRRLIRALRRSKKRAGSALAALDLECKIGYGLYPEHGPDAAALLNQAHRLRLGARL